MVEEQVISEGNVDTSLPTKVGDLGATLQAARLEKKLTQVDVSNSLRYSVKQIDALENNLFDILPDAMMTRGFIRSYAKFLQIDAEPLLASYRASLGEDLQKVISVKSSMRPVALTKENLPWLRYILATIVVLLFLLAWMAYVEYMPKQAPVVDSNTQSDTSQTGAELEPEPANPNVEALPEIALPAAERSAESDASLVPPDTSSTPLNNAASNMMNIGADASSGAQAVQTTPAAPVAPAPINTQGSVAAAKNITFSFTGQSWVSIMDKSGKVVFEKLYQGGETETIQASPPLNLVVGNASVTQLTVSGQPIDLATKTKNNVARITLE